MHRHLAATSVLAALLFSGLATSSAAAATAELVESLEVGVGSIYKVGHWTPVALTLKSDAVADLHQIRLETPDANGVPVQYIVAGKDLRRHGDTVDAKALVRFASLRNTLRVTLHDRDDEILVSAFVDADSLPRPLTTDQHFVVSVGADAGIAQAVAMRTGQRIIHHHLDTADALPKHILAYASIDTVVLTTSDLDVDNPAVRLGLRGLSRWVEHGGNLMICGAAEATNAMNPPSDLSRLVPGRILGTARQRQTSGIEQFISASSPLDSRNRTHPLIMAQLELQRGTPEAWEGFGANRIPSVIHSTAGLGRVVFLAFDLDREPLASWPDRPKLVNRLLDFTLGNTEVDDGMIDDIGPVAHVGYSDLVGQLAAALDRYAGVRMIPFSWVAVLMAIYIVIVGPLDYWLVHRWRRPEWTWATFLATVAIFSGLAVFLAFNGKGRSIQLNQATVLDGDLQSGIVRAVTWSHLFVPRTMRVDLSATPSDQFAGVPSQSVNTWQGVPGDGFGGLHRNPESSALFESPYTSKLNIEFPDQAQIDLANLPMAIWSSRSLSNRWWQDADWSGPLQATRLQTTGDGVVTGDLTNPWPFEVRDALLLYDRWVYKLGSIAPGATISINATTGSDLHSMLTQRRVINGRNVATPWNRQNVDVQRILQLLMFYESAKGRTYTQLNHRYQSELDWSHKLAADLGILWGVCDAPMTTLRLDEQSVEPQQSHTYCRLLLPITTSEN